MTQLFVALLLLLPAASAEAERQFSEAVQATASKDFTTALERFEAALSLDPDNVRYGSEYRQAVIQAKAYDRCIAFFEKLVVGRPEASNAHLNLGFAVVDKIPAAGAITQVILANTALSHFTRSLEIRPSWIGYYTRGNSYLYWPRIFNRTHLGIADLEAALKLQQSEAKRYYHARTFVSLGDGYWKMDEFDKAKATWRQGAEAFPENSQLKTRLNASQADVQTLLGETYDPNRRVDTNLKDLWTTE